MRVRGAALAGAFLLVAGACAEEEPPAAGTPAEAEVAAGARLFARNGCAVCHGDQGRGDGKMAAALRPPPRNLHEVEAYRRGRTVAEIAGTIREGISTGRGGMPGYAHLSEEDRLLLARYIVSLQGK
ncbi:MAG: cytochrome c [Gemmatimonadota bacterium]